MYIYKYIWYNLFVLIIVALTQQYPCAGHADIVALMRSVISLALCRHADIVALIGVAISSHHRCVDAQALSR